MTISILAYSILKHDTERQSYNVSKRLERTAEEARQRVLGTTESRDTERERQRATKLLAIV